MSTRRPRPKAEPMVESGDYDRFADLARKLLTVSKTEIDTARAERTTKTA